MDGGSPPEWGYSVRLPDALLAPRGWDQPVRGIPVPPRKPQAHPDEAKDKPRDDEPPRDSGKDEGEKDQKLPMSRGRKIIYGFTGVLLLATLVPVGVLYWLHSRHFETTDDAFIDGNISQEPARLAGRVTRIAFQDN